MDFNKMMRDVWCRLGFEDEQTIKFCEMCENATSESDKAMVLKEYMYLMSLSVFDDDEDDDEYEDYDDVDECGFNPYEGCYDYDC